MTVPSDRSPLSQAATARVRDTAPVIARHLQLALLGAALMVATIAAACRSDSSTQHSNGSTPSAELPKHPHVVIVMIDTLRADHLGFMGYKAYGDVNITPNLDRWAAEGIVFDHAYSSAPWTPPSIASLLTGLTPTVHHVFDHGDKYFTPGMKKQGDQLPIKIETLAEAFSASGYQTAAIVSNPYISKTLKFDQGFDSFDELPPTINFKYAVAGDIIRKTAEVTGTRDTSKPMLLYLHFMDVHAPYDAPDEAREPFVEYVRRLPKRTRVHFDGRPGPGKINGVAAKTRNPDSSLQDYAEYWTALYDAGIHNIDGELKRLELQLKEANLWDNAIVVVLADHGEALGEHDGWSHGLTIHDHQLHVPLLFRYPPKWNNSTRIDTTVSLLDIKATLMELCNVTSSQTTQSRSFASLFDRKITPAYESRAFAEGVKYAQNLKAIHANGQKIVFDTLNDRAVWFDLAKDPLELKREPLATGGTRIAELKKQLDAIIAENETLKNHFPIVRVSMPPETQAKLNDLGYMNDSNDDDDDTADAPTSINLPAYGAFLFDPAEDAKP